MRARTDGIHHSDRQFVLYVPRWPGNRELATLPRLSIPSCRADGRLHRHGQAVTLLRLFPSTAATLDFHRRVLPVLPGAVLSRHLNTSQRAVAEAKRAKLDAEYGAIVVKMKAEARGRKTATLKRGKEKPSPVPKQVTERDRTSRETSTTRARSAGTNRRYLEACNDAAEIMLESRRGAGALLAGMEKAKGTLRRGNTMLPRGTQETFSDLGLSRMDSHRWQLEALPPDAGVGVYGRSLG